MKLSFCIVITILAFVVGIAAFSAWLFFRYDSKQQLEIQQAEILVPPIKGKVEFYFLECAGKMSVFILENQTDHSIYARVQRADFWKEYKDANLEYGFHLIEYKSPDAKEFKDASGKWDAVEPFKEIKPNSKVRYGITLQHAKGGYIIKIPYMEDAEIARQLDEDFATIIKQDFERVKTSWKEVRSDVVTNQCY